MSLDEHIVVVKRVLKILEDNNLYLKPEKCFFHKTSVDYLSLRISQNQIAMDPVKVEGITKWPEPRNKKDLQSFLGFVNFYRRFIKDFAKIAQPLHKLTGKVDWNWMDEQCVAFN